MLCDIIVPPHHASWHCSAPLPVDLVVAIDLTGGSSDVDRRRADATALLGLVRDATAVSPEGHPHTTRYVYT